MEEAAEVDGIEDLNLTQINEEIQQYSSYQRLIEAFKNGDNLKILHDNHPCQEMGIELGQNKYNV